MKDSTRRTTLETGLLAVLLAATVLPAASLFAQTAASDTTTEALLTLPDAPSFSSNAEAAYDSQGAQASPRPSATPTGATLPQPSHTSKYIEPGQIAPKLTVGDKALLGVKDAFSPFAAIGWLASAGYSHALNGSPNYGTDRGAFGQRLGAAALRDSSEGIFGDSILAPILHEDPRYYRMGPGRNVLVRLIYSGTRPIMTRTDGGRQTPNFAQLGGNLAGSALTQAYYPQLNRGLTQTMMTFGGSIGGSAIGDVVSEFYGDFIGLFHSHK